MSSLLILRERYVSRLLPARVVGWIPAAVASLAISLLLRSDRRGRPRPP